jgi:hypothetical protein
MATALQVIGRFSPLLGLLPSTLERQLRAQRLAGQVPTGRPGGGRFSAHFEAQHFINVILGLAGLEPSGAPAAAALLLSPLPRQSTVNPPPGVPPPLPTLEDQLENWISAIAAAYRCGGQALRDVIATFQTWDMSLCLAPRRVLIQQVDPWRLIVYGREDSKAALRRVTVIHGSLMLAAGELLAASHEQIEALVAKVSSTQPATAGAERENAEGLLQEAPGVLRDQPRANGTDQSCNALDGIDVKREFQAGPVTLTETGSDDRCQTTTMLMT